MSVASKIVSIPMLPLHVGANVESPPVTPGSFAGSYHDPITPEAVQQLSEEQKLALLQMSTRLSVNAVYAAIRDMRATANDPLPPFTGSTFAELREFGLCERKPANRFHRLTTRGSQVADLVARQLVKERNIHWSWMGGNDGATVTLHCTCGWSCGIARGRNTQMKAIAAHSQHLLTVRSMNDLGALLTPPAAKAKA